MFCTKCGRQLAEGEVCTCEQEVQAQSQPQQDGQPQGGWQPQQPKPSDNRKLFSILSYVGILWLIGLFVSPEKNDPRVRFNVGQGIILSIFDVAVGIVCGILQAIIRLIFRKEIILWGVSTGVYEVSGFGAVLIGLLGIAASAVCVAMAIIGIVNVYKEKDTYLPVIGKFAFYK